MNIKEIEERSGLTRANIRYYEQEGLIAPVRRDNKYRDYSEENLETLLRIALLRNLGFSLDEIRRLQSGELELAAAMRERSAALESEGQRLLAARNVCDAISREVTSYSTLQAEPYLTELEPDAVAGQRDVAEPHPWRRYLARAIDLTLVGLPVSFVQYVLLHRNYTTVSRWEDLVCALISWGLLLLLEPLLLARFGTTAGKWCMGITVTRPDGERLSYSEALNRTALVWFYGAGLGLPLVELVCSYLSYRRYTRGEELAWEEGSIERFDERGMGRMVLLYAASTALSLALTLAMALSAALPPNRGDLTVAEFAENVNFYRGYFDCGERWSLDENGEWAENQYENVVYFGGGGEPAPFTYTVEEGTLRAVHWAYTETAETIYGTGDENARMAYLALAAAQKGTSLFNIRSVVKQIGSNSWAGDTDYSAAWKNVEMRYDARIEGEYYYSEGFFLSVQDGQPITVTLTFDARLAE
ncbi:MAG: MerR family transcriptional regulator [Oscillospiraceae bacterium]|nr:MerR family transcriptional regulator [Oscillospiraceae bacterium]